MEKILQELWKHEYDPLEKDGPNRSLLSESYGTMDEIKVYLTKTLSGEPLEAFLKYEAAASEAVALSMEDSYVRGVRFAVRFFMDSLA